MFDTLIQAEELLGLPSEEVAILDCRFALADPDAGKCAFLDGHVPGASHLDLARDLSGAPGGDGGRHPLPESGAFAATLRAAGLRRHMQVVAYDDAGGPYAARAWWMLRWLGHPAAAVLDGGWQAWQAAGGAIERGEARVRSGGDFVASAPLAQVADAGEIQASIGTDRLLVIDARSPERFAGAPDPLDPVAGHIPGARNRFYRDNLDEAEKFKSAARLQSEFAATMVGMDPEHVILQCGSGVTACHDLLAMEIAHLGGARLYPGSWSGWINDPMRPIVTETASDR